MRTLLWHSVAMLLTLVTGGLGGLGCSVSGAVDPEADAPIHLHIVCPASADGQAVLCEGTERRAAFEAWLGEALSKPSSTFTLWSVGDDRRHAAPLFTACVPPAWGAGVMQAKAGFVTAVREGASGNRKGAAPQGCVPPGPLTPGTHRLQVSTARSPMHPRVWQPVVAPPGAAPPLHTAIVCDRSNSTLGMACTTASLLGAFDGWLADSRATAGAWFAIYRVGSSRDTAQAIYTLAVPERAVGERVAFLLGARAELPQVLPERAAPNASAIAEAISVAVGELRQRGGRYRLVVLSDLRQVTPRRWNFEQVVPPAPRFVAWLQASHLAVDLRGIPVLACSLHHQRGPGASPHDAPQATQLRQVWAHAWRAMGAPDVEMFPTCEAALASR